MRKKIFLILGILCSSLLKAEVEKPLYFSNDMVYIDDSSAEERTGIYTLNIKGSPVNYTYELIKENGNYYFPVISFFQSIGMKNYSKNGDVIKYYLGNDLKEGIINPAKLGKGNYILEGEDIYISETAFENAFAERIDINPNMLSVNIIPSFTTPEDIKFLLKATENKLKEESNMPVLNYTNERELIDLGNLRVNLQGSVINGKENSKKNDWNGFLEYSSPFLYGNLLTDYDLKEHKFGDTKLRYSDIYDGNYDLEMGLYGPDKEKGLSFKKDKGYYEDGKNYVITEKVPLGSRVELLFGGIPIDIAYEENGEVTFHNNLLKSGRTYNLKIYSPDGTIEEKEIKITEDYNLQNKGQFGYDIDIRENKDAKKYASDLNVYYGATRNLTLGFGYQQNPEMVEDKYLMSKDLKGQVIYSNFLFNNSYSYTLRYEGEKSIDQNKEFEKKYSHSVLLDTNIKNLNVKVEQKNNGEYYKEKNEQYLELKYDFTDNITLNYDYEKINLYDDTSETDYSYGIQTDKSWNSLLVSLEANNNRKNEKEYGLDLYYTGFKYMIAKLSNKIDSKGEYEATLKLMNKAWSDTLEYSFETSYSTSKKSVYTLDFKVKLDNWFEIGTYLEKNGENKGYMGIDKVIDLANPLERIENIDSARLKIKTFIDANNNNKFDKDEKPTGNIEVTLGERTITTDEHGNGTFYGLPSNAEYDLEVNSLRPTLNGEKTKVKVRGTGSGTIKAFIPIKPQVELNGYINLDLKGLNENQKIDIYNNLLITVTNKEAKYEKTFYADSDGNFYLTDIYPGQYTVKIIYEGTDYKLKDIDKIVDLVYGDNSGQNDVTFDMEE
ncbi:carboxypeptidase-like regulatory domain-containing protein [Cetobacterium sp. SF1]|uniref:carboxypeptidase-like regulatory domain-containing protein n=1 Tax=Cetobacterium sp. SF1 TaxID=3417654 RepID=UPI003CF9626F